MSKLKVQMRHLDLGIYSDFGFCHLDFFSYIGAWRSLVAYLLGVQVVGRSNRLAPTNFLKGPDNLRAFCCYSTKEAGSPV